MINGTIRTIEKITFVFVIFVDEGFWDGLPPLSDSVEFASGLSFVVQTELCDFSV